MYAKHQVWPVLDYNEITKWVDRKTEKSKVTPGCMYMSVKCNGKKCYVQNKSSKPVKWITLNLCINYHTIRWFATSRMSSSLNGLSFLLRPNLLRTCDRGSSPWYEAFLRPLPPLFQCWTWCAGASCAWKSRRKPASTQNFESGSYPSLSMLKK